MVEQNAIHALLLIITITIVCWYVPSRYTFDVCAPQGPAAQSAPAAAKLPAPSAAKANAARAARKHKLELMRKRTPGLGVTDPTATKADTRAVGSRLCQPLDVCVCQTKPIRHCPCVFNVIQRRFVVGGGNGFLTMRCHSLTQTPAYTYQTEACRSSASESAELLTRHTL